MKERLSDLAGSGGGGNGGDGSGSDGGVGVAGNNGWWRILLWKVVLFVKS